MSSLAPDESLRPRARPSVQNTARDWQGPIDERPTYVKKGFSSLYDYHESLQGKDRPAPNYAAAVVVKKKATPPPAKYDLTLGYDPISIFRPKFIYFEFNGLRPNIPHYFFFGEVLVNKWVNTSKTENDLISASRNSALLEPGERYKSATSFPSAQGGPTNGGGDTPIAATAAGRLSGLFFIQSNDTVNFPITSAGINLIVTDIDEINLDKCKSIAGATFYGYGQYENYFNGTAAEIAEAKKIQETLQQNSIPGEEIV